MKFNHEARYAYIKQFWVGLMEGDGSIQVNHWRSKLLQFRLVIKLKYLESNYNMLIIIAKVIGGSVRVDKHKKFVVWVVDDKKEISEIIKIFDKYPLLTSRKICQLQFLKTCLNDLCIDSYFKTRDFKYDRQKAIILGNSTKKFYEDALPSPACGASHGWALRPYFGNWLSGFIEAEGCFCLRKNNNSSFSIGQKSDLYIIENIKSYLKASNAIRNPSKDFYSLEIYKREILMNLCRLFQDSPLLGEKRVSFSKFDIFLSLSASPETYRESGLKEIHKK